MKPDENVVYRLNQHSEIPVQLHGKDVPVRYYTVEEIAPAGHPETKGTLLFVHGIRDNALYFEPIARCFVSRGYRAFLLELPGYDARRWGTSAQLDEYTIPVFAEYLQRAIEALETTHHLARHEWIVWGHSMGGAVVYRAMAQNPATFRQFAHIVLEAPAFASRLTFGSKFTIWLSQPLSKSSVGRSIGRKLVEAYHVHEGRAPEVVSYVPLEIEGFMDSYAIFHQVAVSIKGTSNNFDLKTLQEIGGTRLLWIWSPNDQAVHAKPPEVIPVKQQLRLTLTHTASLVAPQEVCQKVARKFAELK